MHICTIHLRGGHHGNPADKGIQAGDPRKIADLVEAKILPHFDFRLTTQLAMGVNWRRATPEQQELLTRVCCRARTAAHLSRCR
jgi:hypothetical protein